MRRKAVIVLGMHRSGTSTTSGILNILGFDLGKAIMGANEANPKGFFENHRIMSYNEDLFKMLHVNWHNTVGLLEQWWNTTEIDLFTKRLTSLILDEFTFESPLLFKDPRICILLPIYLEAFKVLNIEPFFILTYRNPDEVAESLKKRDNFSCHKSARIWIDHMLKAEKHTRNYPRIIIDYNYILADPIAALKKMLSIFPLHLPISPVLQEQVIQFVEPALNHCQRSRDSAPANNDLEFKWVYYIFKRITCCTITSEEQLELDLYSNWFYSTFGSEKWPKVSVIVKARNEPEPLEKTIISVVSQDYPNIEFILIDNGSEKETLYVIEKYKYLLSGCLIMPAHGQFDGMKQLIGTASGDWITFLNAGDSFIHKDSLWEFIRLLSNECIPDIGFGIHEDQTTEGYWQTRRSEKRWKVRLLWMSSLFIRS